MADAIAQGRAKSTWVYRISLAVLILLVLCGLMLAYVYHWLQTESGADTLAQLLSDKLGHPVIIDAPIKTRLYPFFSVDVAAIRAGTEDNHWLTTGPVRLRLNSRAALARRLLLESLDIKQLNLNWTAAARLLQEQNENSAFEQTEQAAADWNIDSLGTISISGGRLRLSDSLSVVLHSLRLREVGAAEERSINIHADTCVDFAADSCISLAASGSLRFPGVSLNPQAFAWQIEQLRAQLPDVGELLLSGAEGEYRQQQLRIRQANLGLSNVVKAKLLDTAIDWRGELNWSTRAQAQGMGQEFTELAVTVTAQGGLWRLQAPAFELGIAGEMSRGVVNACWNSRGMAEVDVSLDRLSLDQLGLYLPFQGAAGSDAEELLQIPTDWPLFGTITVQALSYADWNGENVKIHMEGGFHCLDSAAAAADAPAIMNSSDKGGA